MKKNLLSRKKSKYLVLCLLLIAISNSSQLSLYASNKINATAHEQNYELKPYQDIIDEINSAYDLNLELPVPLPDEMPPLEEFRRELIEGAMMLKDAKDKEKLSTEPNHDMSVVIFDQHDNIKVYLNENKIDILKNLPYPVRINKHDEIMLPIEELSDALDISVTWDKQDNTVSITHDDILYILNIKENTISYNGMKLPFDIIACEEKNNSLYVNQSVFSIVGSFTPIIYHNLNKVVLVSPDIHTNAYANTYSNMIQQFARVDYPLSDPISLEIHGKTVDFALDSFVSQTKEKDYLMIPLRQFQENLGYTVEWKEGKKEALVKVQNNAFTIRMEDGKLFQNNENIVIEGPPPIIKNDRIYISHEYLNAINHLYSFFDYKNNTITFNNLD